MKLKKCLLWGLAFVLFFSLDSCKPKESAYKAAYETAKAREFEENAVYEVTPVTRPTTDWNDVVQRERVTVIDGTGILRYSVVIGSFLNRTNAENLKERMADQGFRSFLAQNDRGMYRVIVATFNDRASAVSERERVKNRYYPNYHDAWILDNQ